VRAVGAEGSVHVIQHDPFLGQSHAVLVFWSDIVSMVSNEKTGGLPMTRST